MIHYRQLGVLLAIGAALSACAVPSERFYTLHGVAAEIVAPHSAPGYFIELEAVTVPAQVRREQLMVTQGDGRIRMLEQERWAGPLAGEIGQALSLGVTQELGAIDVYRMPHPESVPVYRISTTVQRFESVQGQSALIEAVWSVREPGRDAVLTCRSVIREPAAAGYDALVAGHRSALRRIAAQMAGAIRGLAKGGAGSCGT